MNVQLMRCRIWAKGYFAVIVGLVVLDGADMLSHVSTNLFGSFERAGCLSSNVVWAVDYCDHFCYLFVSLKTSYNDNETIASKKVTKNELM